MPQIKSFTTAGATIGGFPVPTFNQIDSDENSKLASSGTYIEVTQQDSPKSTPMSTEFSRDVT